MPARESDVRIEVTPTDPSHRVWSWRVFDGEEVVEQGTSTTKKDAHQQAHDASQKYRKDVHTQGHGSKKHAKEE